jgi:hypothetical protein
LLSLAQSKLVTYIWPVFPAVAILAAVGWSRLIDGTISPAAKESLRKNFLMSSFTGPFVLPIAVLVLQIAFDLHFGWPVWAASILAGLGTLVPLWFLFRSHWQRLLAASALATAAQFLVVVGLVLPVVAEIYSEKALAMHFNESYESLPGKMYFVEERIGSFVFYLKPELRQAIAVDQLQEIQRPEIALKAEPYPSGSMVIVPKQRVERASEYLELKGHAYSEAERYRLFEDRKE